MSLYGIIKSLQTATGSLNKQAILDAHKNDVLLKAYLKAVYDPAINYYQTKICKSDVVYCCVNEFDEGILNGIIHHLAKRTITGKQAERWLTDLYICCNSEGKELTEWLIKRSVGAGIGDTMVLKTFPNLYFIPPYQRCSLMDAKIRSKFNSLDEIIVQLKADGAFAYVVKQAGWLPQVITRAGNKYPQWFANRLCMGIHLDSYVFVGELLVYKGYQGSELPRQTGNGVLNKIRQSTSGEDFGEDHFKLSAWDYLNYEDFISKKSDIPYCTRLAILEKTLVGMETQSINLIDTSTAGSLEEAYKINSEYLLQGKEGSVIKNPMALWRDGTSKDLVKLKISFEVDLKIVGITEGTGKYAGSMGSLSLSSSDGLLETDVGTGFDDETREYFWDNRHTLVENSAIITVKANDITTQQGSSIKSLFLPVYMELRHDKHLSDTYEHCVAQLAAARG